MTNKPLRTKAIQSPAWINKETGNPQHEDDLNDALERLLQDGKEIVDIKYSVSPPNAGVHELANQHNCLILYR